MRASRIRARSDSRWPIAGLTTSSTSTGDQLWVDYAVLTPISGLAPQVGAISAEQQAANEAANRNGGGSKQQAGDSSGAAPLPNRSPEGGR